MPAVEGNDVETAGGSFGDAVFHAEEGSDFGDGALFGEGDGFHREAGDFRMTVFDLDEYESCTVGGNDVDFPVFAAVISFDDGVSFFGKAFAGQLFIDGAQGTFVFGHGV